MDKLLMKDVNKGKITAQQASEARERVKVVDTDKGVNAMRDADMVIEVRAQQFTSLKTLQLVLSQAVSENLSLKQTIFRELSSEVSPSAILASNTSSISITKIAASTIPEGSSAADEAGKRSASRVVGKVALNTSFRLVLTSVIS